MGIRALLSRLREKVEDAFRRDDPPHPSHDSSHLKKIPGANRQPPYPPRGLGVLGTRAAIPASLAARSLQARSITDAKGVIWCPSATDVPTPDRRYGKPLLIVEHTPFAQYQLKIWDSMGKEIGKLGFFNAHTRDRGEWYSGYGAGSHDSAKELAEKARKAGDGTIFIEWEHGYVIGPIRPTELTGSL